jgi:hypothetical protein
MIRRLLASTLFAAVLPAAAQSVPATNYTDLWDNSAAPGATACPGGESGWGITFTQHTGTNEVEAVWYTYDPRLPDTTSPGNFKPLWLVMPGGTWTTPATFTGDMYVTLGTPFGQAWAFNSTTNPLPVTKVGSFTFTFTNSSTGTFAYNVAPPAANVANSTDPAFKLPSFSGTKPICRNNAF